MITNTVIAIDTTSAIFKKLPDLFSLLSMTDIELNTAMNKGDLYQRTGESGSIWLKSFCEYYDSDCMDKSQLYMQTYTGLYIALQSTRIYHSVNDHFAK